MSKALRTKSHGTFRLQYHIVFLIRYRHKVITSEILSRLEGIFRTALIKWECELVEFSGESDHVHLLIEAHPSIELSKLIGNLKTVSARRIRTEFNDHLKPFFWKPYFWSRSYCVVTTGGASLDKLKQYIQQQDKPD